MNNPNDPRKWWMINIIVIIIIIILILSRCSKNTFAKNNIDSFDININCSNKDNIYIEDNNGLYDYQKEINIFNSFQSNNNMIAPGYSGIYNFRVNNKSNMNIKYQLEFRELEEYNINIRYRLKRNKEYIVGSSEEWKEASKIKTSFLDLEDNATDNYYLEWLWIDSNDELDSYIGRNMKDFYKLNIQFHINLDNNCK